MYIRVWISYTHFVHIIRETGRIISEKRKQFYEICRGKYGVPEKYTRMVTNLSLFYKDALAI